VVNSTDKYSPAKRSEIMSNVKSKNTKPEKLVRSLLHKLGYRFRLHKDLPGHPDIVLSKYKAVIFVHGCFWHQHPGCKKATYPKNNADFWIRKLDTNIERDRRNEMELERLGWKVLVVWECETKHQDVLINQLREFLSSEK
jgi:DNA mismatch endonuclease, patch repair protein